jgi:hypothetical protein
LASSQPRLQTCSVIRAHARRVVLDRGDHGHASFDSAAIPLLVKRQESSLVLEAETDYHQKIQVAVTQACRVLSTPTKSSCTVEETNAPDSSIEVSDAWGRPEHNLFAALMPSKKIEGGGKGIGCASN